MSDFLSTTAYDGYQFSLPAFLDFRGRIYRSGILHFHERDLARSLIVFAKSNDNDDLINNENFRNLNNDKLKHQFYASASFHYKAFDTTTEGANWFVTSISLNINKFSNNIVLAREAKRPFQFLATVVKNNFDIIIRIPICHDASASAYQIMSDFLLDKRMAERTNLFPDGQDVYSFFLDELIMKENVNDPHLTKTVCNLLTRQIVKGIYMPIIYGQTLMSTANDLEDMFSHYITRKESFQLAKVFFEFWKTKYSGMECLIKLIRHIGWVVSARGSPVFYRASFCYTTVQDYMVSEPARISVYDKNSRKRRWITLRINTSKRDRRKTEIATFVNFIRMPILQ